MGLLSMDTDSRDTLIRSVALLASVFSQGTMVGHSAEDTEGRADRYVDWITRKEERDQVAGGAES